MRIEKNRDRLIISYGDKEVGFNGFRNGRKMRMCQTYAIAPAKWLPMTKLCSWKSNVIGQR